MKSGPALQRAEHSALVAVMRRNGDLARDYAQRHGVARWYDDAEALVNDPDVDAVYVATPPSSHRDYALLAARAGRPVYVEKPMARSFAECREMIDGCRAAGVNLFVAYYRRALARFLRIRQLIDTRVVGDVRFVQVVMFKPLAPASTNGEALPWRVIPEIAGGGHFVDLGSHMLDFLDFALGPIRSAYGVASNQAGHYPAEDVVTSTFQFESGVQGTGTWCFNTDERRDWTEIVGTDGRIAYSTFGDSPIQVTTRAGTSELAIAVPRHIQQELIQTIVDELNGIGQCPSTGESAARTSWVMDRVLGKL